VLLNRTVLAAGRTEEVFTQANLERAFGGVLRHLVLPDEEPGSGHGRAVGLISDDERPFILYGAGREATPPVRAAGPGEVS
jgi:manganese/iron transport system ATP-binding protein